MAGKGARIQPIAFSKELYPIVFRKRHYAISEFSVRSLLRAQVDEIKLVIHPEKIDIVNYYARYDAPISMYFNESKNQPESCLFPLRSMNDDDICLFGLPDTLFSPADAFIKVRQEIERGADMCLGLFEVEDGNAFDSVALDSKGNVLEVRAKYNPPALSNDIWGIWGATVKTLRLLKEVIDQQPVADGKEKILGLGMNDLAKRKEITVKGIKLGKDFFDIGSMDAVLHVGSVIDHFDI